MRTSAYDSASSTSLARTNYAFLRVNRRVFVFSTSIHRFSLPSVGSPLSACASSIRSHKLLRCICFFCLKPDSSCASRFISIGFWFVFLLLKVFSYDLESSAAVGSRI